MLQGPGDKTTVEYKPSIGRFIQRSFTKCILPGPTYSFFLSCQITLFVPEISCLEGNRGTIIFLHMPTEIYYKWPHDTFIITKLLEYAIKRMGSSVADVY